MNRRSWLSLLMGSLFGSLFGWLLPVDTEPEPVKEWVVLISLQYDPSKGEWEQMCVREIQVSEVPYLTEMR